MHVNKRFVLEKKGEGPRFGRPYRSKHPNLVAVLSPLQWANQFMKEDSRIEPGWF